MTPPILTREQVRQVDQRAIEGLGMSGLVLMENAGRGCVDVLCRLGVPGPVVVCCGRGNNAGDGFVIARHLDLRGYPVKVLLFTEPASLGGDAAENFRLLTHTDVSHVVLSGELDVARLDAELASAAWIVDALLGTGARGEPRPPFDVVIDRLNASPARRLAIDLPSGLDCDTGEAATHTFRAEHTCTFVAAKPGLVAEGAAGYIGELHVLDIGVPRRLVEEMLAET